MAHTGNPGPGSRYVVPMCVLLGLSLSLAFQTASLAPLHPDNRKTFHALAGGIEQYREFTVAWRPRLFTNYLAAKLISLGEHASASKRTDKEKELQYTVAAWSAFWFSAIGLLYILAATRQSLFYLFGTFSAIQFGYLPQLLRVYPWDLPIIFIFAAFVILYSMKQYWWVLFLLPLGMGFKETTAVLCLAFLFCDLPKKRRAFMFGLSLAMCLIAKTAIDVYVQVPLVIFTMEHGYEAQNLENLYLIRNVKALISVHFLPLLVNGGTLLTLLILPPVNQTARALRAMGVVFVTSILLFGLVDEFRIFFEMIPFALYSLAVFSYGEGVADGQERRSRQTERDAPADRSTIFE